MKILGLEAFGRAGLWEGCGGDFLQRSMRFHRPARKRYYAALDAAFKGGRSVCPGFLNGGKPKTRQGSGAHLSRPRRLVRTTFHAQSIHGDERHHIKLQTRAATGVLPRREVYSTRAEKRQRGSRTGRPSSFMKRRTSNSKSFGAISTPFLLGTSFGLGSTRDHFGGLHGTMNTHCDVSHDGGQKGGIHCSKAYFIKPSCTCELCRSLRLPALA